MEKFANQIYPSTAAQAAMMLMAALREFKSEPERQAVFSFIKSENWFAFYPEDQTHYESATERRWHTLLSWARENCVETELIKRKPANCWTPTKEGLNSVFYAKEAFRNGTQRVSLAYLWTPTLKRYFDPNYVQSTNDKIRPEAIYKDHLKAYQDSVRGSKITRRIDHLLRGGKTTQDDRKLFRSLLK